MPTYEYRCKECGEHLEVVQSFTDDPLTECPACSGPLRKVFGSVGISFKGSGFYKTDSRGGSKGGGTRDRESTTAGSSSEGKGDGKSDTKGDTKSDSAKPAASTDSSSSTSKPETKSA
jgi:putative FmdB family regulatory protein